MRTAVVIAGMLREAELAHRSWSFINEDIHVTTWDVSLEGNNAVRSEPEPEPITLASIPFPHVSACVLSYEVPINVAMRSSFLWRHAEIELSAYEAEHGRYDRVLLSRPDVFFDFDIDLAAPLAAKEIVGLSCIHWFDTDAGGHWVVQDICFLMSRENFARFGNFHAYRFGHPLTYDVHATLAAFLQSQQITVRAVGDFRYCIVRKPSRGLPWTGSRDDMYKRLKSDAEAWWIFHRDKLP